MQAFVHPKVDDRRFLLDFYKMAWWYDFNVEKYNELKDELYLVC